MVLEFLPLVVVVALAALLGLTAISKRLDAAVSQVALGVFGSWVDARATVTRQQQQYLHSAHVGTTYRLYAARTFLYATVAAVVGSVGGVYLVATVLTVLSRAGMAERLPDIVQTLVPSPAGLSLVSGFLVLLVSSATVGVLGALATYQVRWAIPKYVAGERERRIDNTIKRNVAFVYALSRSSMSFPKNLRVLARNQPTYGETAAEMAITVKEIDLLGTDVLSAIDRLGERTPSQELQEFAENLTSVLQSGQSLSAFLREQYEYFKNEEEAQQQAFLELLSTLAEAYVTVFVAGPLFLLTILVVIGLMLGETLQFLRAMVYLILPLATLGFVVYLDTITEDVREAVSEQTVAPEAGRFTDVRVDAGRRGVAVPGGQEALTRNRYRLHLYRRYRPILNRLGDPVRSVTERPVLVLAVTVPLALLWTLAGWWPHLAAGEFDAALYDDPIIQATLFVVATFAVTFEVANRRRKAIEMAIPDFLDRLASTNEAGMSVVESFGRVVRSDLGALSEELERTWADIVWGAPVENALARFQRRVNTPAVTRVVTLTTNAMSATNDVGPVLRIAADEAQAAKRLERERRNEMLTYTVVVYLSFFVFLVIVVALDMIFVPAIPTGGMGAGAGGLGGVAGGGIGGGLQQVTAQEKAAYSLIFSHAAIVQAVASGFVAGQMGEGSVKAGAKHATVMLTIAYGIFLFVG
ncbi:MAG: type II secretion system F family protein [Halanaeroarchaeum sp.]